MTDVLLLTLMIAFVAAVMLTIGGSLNMIIWWMDR